MQACHKLVLKLERRGRVIKEFANKYEFITTSHNIKRSVYTINSCKIQSEFERAQEITEFTNWIKSFVRHWKGNSLLHLHFNLAAAFLFFISIILLLSLSDGKWEAFNRPGRSATKTRYISNACQDQAGRCRAVPLSTAVLLQWIHIESAHKNKIIVDSHCHWS